ncbi:ribonuclease H-like domain-containing protein [Hyaloraphidium curvatum]|nr:ribonuclease H-like domain-containing protein [Hyaloraphidium curvatum]
MENYGAGDKGPAPVPRTGIRAEETREDARVRTLLARRRELPNAHSAEWLVVMDLECTCEEGSGTEYPNEVIEMAAIVVCARSLLPVAEFTSFAKPVLNKELSPFCNGFVGITQEQVDEAPSFEEAFRAFVSWLRIFDSTPDLTDTLFVTDGDTDLQKFIPTTCSINKIVVPPCMKRWTDLKVKFGQAFKRRDYRKLKIPDMLRVMGERFEGTPHRGIDDTRNIVRILQRVIEKGVRIEPTWVVR